MHEYGIHTSKADFWIHVSPCSRELFIYERIVMAEAVSTGAYQQRETRTSIGWLVPTDTWFIRRISLRDAPLWGAFKGHMGSDADFGHRCEDLVRTWLNVYGGFPPLLQAELITKKAEQIQGRDLLLRQPLDVCIEVKGDEPIADTRNLFVQTHEQGHVVNKRNAHRHQQPALGIVVRRSDR